MKRGFSVLVNCSFPAGLTVYGQSSRKYIKAGEEFVRNNMFDDAIDQFSRAIDEAPASAEGYVKRARAYELTGNYGLAYDDYKRAVISCLMIQASFIIWAGCATSLPLPRIQLPKRERNIFSEAVSVLQKAIKAEYRNGKLYTEKVVSLIGMELWDRALGTSDTALQMRDDAINYYYQGIIYQKNK